MSRPAVAAAVAAGALAAASPALGIGENVKVPGTDTFPSTGEVTVAVNVPGQGRVTEKITLSSRGLPPAVMTRGALDVKQRTIPIELVEMALQGRGKKLGRVVLIAGQRFGPLPPGTIPGVNVIPGSSTALLPSTGQLTDVDASARIRGKTSNTHLTNPAGGLISARIAFSLYWELALLDVAGLGLVSGRSGNTPTPVDGGTGDSVPLNAPEATRPQVRNLNHHKCYRADGVALNQKVKIQDQFDVGHSETVVVRQPVEVCNPVDVMRRARGAGPRRGGVRKVTPSNRGTDRRARLDHLVCYRLTTDRRPEAPPKDKILVTQSNRFTAGGVDADPTTRTLCVPSSKDLLRQRERQVKPLRGPSHGLLDHFACYPAERDGSEPAGQPFGRAVLADQFERRMQSVTEVERFCNPVNKVHGDTKALVRNPGSHLVGLRVQPGGSPERKLFVRNQVAPDGSVLTTFKATRLLIPTAKRHCSRWEPDLPPKQAIPIDLAPINVLGDKVGEVKSLKITPNGRGLSIRCPTSITATRG